MAETAGMTKLNKNKNICEIVLIYLLYQQSGAVVPGLVHRLLTEEVIVLAALVSKIEGKCHAS